jgi:hypothetical protein
VGAVVDENATSSGAVKLGVFISASILTPLIRRAGSASGKSSLFAQSVHAKVSPTYAFPKAGGRVSRGERTKVSSETVEDLDG